ncbi:HAD-IC family P-type ATPase [Pseudorhodobacter sp. W20_MBD10_FR17]|uniref:HAD-IC family P-type ATPase n=1 Tax=Pseudorhodobacter sp. W20_MBD10_FR17 TaxID=3240266 RepID=UPI003F99171D
MISPLQHPHAKDTAECYEAMATTETGLSDKEAARRLVEHGPNRLPVLRRRSRVLRFLAHFHNVLVYVLIIAAIVTASLDHWVDTGVILAVVIANAVIGFIQEGRAEDSMAAIRQMLAPQASVLRSDARISIEAFDLVPGDVVLLEAGDKVPADLRLIAVKGLRVQEAILTGESVAAEKVTEAVTADAALGDRVSMAFSGTLVVAGTGRGVVVATGSATEIGRISGMLGAVEVLTTPLVQQTDRFARWLTVLILLVAGLLLVFGYFVEHIPFSDQFMAVVGLAVAAIPEGLPAVLTITLSVGVQAMARRNAIVRRLPAIETIGAVSVICTDKTGTLTRNEMMVATAITPVGRFAISGQGYAPTGDVQPEPLAQELHDLGLAAQLCNDASLALDDGTWQIAGDPMEGALLAFAGKTGAKADGWTRLDEIPFEAAHRYMAVLAIHSDGTSMALVKGAPERLLGMCRDQAGRDGPEPLDAAFWNTAAHDIASQGQRVLAVATRAHLADRLDDTDLQGHLTLVGFVGLIDPPREEAIEAIAECYQAGIAVKMITGDHAGTAGAIGKQIGLKNADSVLTGADLDRMTDAELAVSVQNTHIFARTSPEHKLRLVMALQAHGLTVAMTGDGVNDAPALKRADVGIAMGIKGSEAAKEAAELVLADDNFASIAAAVREGRTVYVNLRKVLAFELPTSFGEAGVILVALLLGLALPISPLQVLWINLVTGVTLGLALAFEPTEQGTMSRLPRPSDASLVSGPLIWHIVFVTMLFIVAIFGLYSYVLDKGHAPALAQTISLNMLVVLEIFHLFFVRNIFGTSLTWAAARGTKAVWLCIAIIVPAQLAVTYWPVAQSLFGTASIQFGDGALILAVGVVFFVTIEVEKQLRLTLTGRHVI